MIHPRCGDSRIGSCLAAMTGCVVMAIVGAACNGRETEDAKSSAAVVLRVGVAQFSTTNPGAGLRGLSQNLTIETLLRPSPDGRLQPVLADRWTVSDNGDIVTLHIKGGMKFHDGSLLDPPALAAALPDAMRSLMGPLIDDVLSVRPVLPDQVEVRFRNASPLLLEGLGTQVSKAGSAAVGTGPYMATSNPAEFRANTAYYLGAPSIGRIAISNYPSARSAWAELLRDQLDMLYEVGNDALDSMEASNNVAVFTITRPYQHMVVLNTQCRQLQSKDTRRALNLAIDRPAIVKEALNGHGVASNGPVAPRY